MGGGERKLWREGAGCTRQRPGVPGKHQFYLIEVSGTSSGETGSGEAFSWPPWCDVGEDSCEWGLCWECPGSKRGTRC